MTGTDEDAVAEVINRITNIGIYNALDKEFKA